MNLSSLKLPLTVAAIPYLYYCLITFASDRVYPGLLFEMWLIFVGVYLIWHRDDRENQR